MGKSKNRKSKIMEAALRIFAEKGYQDATIAEISKRAGVSEATIYEHFGTKEELLFAIPASVSNESIEEMEKILPYIKGSEARIRAILYKYLHVYETNPDYAALVLLQLSTNRKFRGTEAYMAIRKAAHILLDCIREGIQDGVFRQDTNAYLVRSVLLGAIEHICIQRHLGAAGAVQEPLLVFLDPLLDIVLTGIRSTASGPELTVRINLDQMPDLWRLLPSTDIKSNQEKEA